MDLVVERHLCSSCVNVCNFPECSNKVEFDEDSKSDNIVKCEQYNTTPERLFISMFTVFSDYVHIIAKDKGWYDQPRNEGELIALVHSELSEAMEALRRGNPPSEKIPEFNQVEEEFADAIIRIMDHAGWKGYRVAAAIIAKIEHNKTRPYKHGGKKF